MPSWLVSWLAWLGLAWSWAPSGRRVFVLFILLLGSFLTRLMLCTCRVTLLFTRADCWKVFLREKRKELRKFCQRDSLKKQLVRVNNLQKGCSAQTRTGIGLLGKPPAVKQFPPSKATRRMRLLRDPAQTQVWSKQVWLNTTFISQGSRSGDKLAVKT